jgi:hypothetical protein
VSKSVADGRVYKPTNAQFWFKYFRGVDSIYERMPTKGAFYYWSDSIMHDLSSGYLFAGFRDFSRHLI